MEPRKFLGLLYHLIPLNYKVASTLPLYSARLQSDDLPNGPSSPDLVTRRFQNLGKPAWSGNCSSLSSAPTAVSLSVNSCVNCDPNKQCAILGLMDVLSSFNTPTGPGPSTKNRSHSLSLNGGRFAPHDISLMSQSLAWSCQHGGLLYDSWNGSQSHATPSAALSAHYCSRISFSGHERGVPL